MGYPNPFNNDALRESVFVGNYSRLTSTDPSYEIDGDGYRTECPIRKETYADVVIRNIEGLFSYYIWHMNKNYFEIDRKEMDQEAENMAISMFRMEMTPPGRGMFMMGTDYCYKNGNAALNNCYATTTKNNFVESMSWTMSNLMCGGGVGIDTDGRFDVVKPDKTNSFLYVIDDTRQGWIAALEVLLRAYIPIDGVITNKFPIFDYHKIRKYGKPIKGFGGSASGPDPLRKLLECTEVFLDTFIKWQNICGSCHTWKADEVGSEGHVSFYLDHFERLSRTCIFSVDDCPDEIPGLIKTICMEHYQPYNHVHLILDIFNMIGYCVHAGNVRRSAELALCDGDDPNFMYIKDWMRYAYRRPYMSNSNNTVRLWTSDDFKKYLPIISARIRNNGEPGIANMINIKRYGRFTDTTYGPDNGYLLNPCGETILKDKEPCCLSIVNPMRCVRNGVIDRDVLMKACKYANFYAMVVNTVPHEWGCTNAVKAENSRIGVSFGGIADVYDVYGNVELVDVMKTMYQTIRKENDELSVKLGVKRSIRVTVVKPDGTMSFVADTSKGVHHHIIDQGIRRIGFGNANPIVNVLKAAGYKYEDSTKGDTTYILYPFKTASRSANKVPAWEKMALIEQSQRHYADNSVSATVDFNPGTEGPDIERLISINMAKLKAISAFPQFDTSNCQYKHLPYEPLDDGDFAALKEGIMKINWDAVYYPNGHPIDADIDGIAGCSGGICEFKKLKEEYESATSE
jgi:hypothetical protein